MTLSHPAEKATPPVAEPGSANAGEKGLGWGWGSHVAAAMAALFSEGVDEVGSLPVRAGPSDIPPAASPVAIEGPLESQESQTKGGSCRGIKPDKVAPRSRSSPLSFATWLITGAHGAEIQVSVAGYLLKFTQWLRVFRVTK